MTSTCLPHHMWNVIDRLGSGSLRTTNVLEAFHQEPTGIPAPGLGLQSRPRPIPDFINNAIHFYREYGTFLGHSKINMSPPPLFFYFFFFNPGPAEIPERPDPGFGQNRVIPAKTPIPVGCCFPPHLQLPLDLPTPNNLKAFGVFGVPAKPYSGLAGETPSES